MKKIKIIRSSKEFEEFVNHETVDVISVHASGCEQSAYAQESFIAVIYYNETLESQFKSDSRLYTRLELKNAMLHATIHDPGPHAIEDYISKLPLSTGDNTLK